MLVPAAWEHAVPSIHDFSATDIDGKEISLANYRGQVMLIVNTASKCGFTPQYEELQALYRDHRSEGFVVLGFPCNQFGEQEPGDAAEIARFCKLNFDIEFPIFAKIDVNGPDTHPLYAHLKHAAPGFLGTRSIKWNFTKFLVDREGEVVRRFPPHARPQTMQGSIRALL